MTTWCIIPARAGSERFPGKNMVPLHGIPLVGHAVRKALASKCDRVIVSTNDPALATYTQASFPRVCLDQRPEKHAKGKSGMLRDYIASRLIPDWEIADGDTVVLLQCTYPYTRVVHIDWAINTALDNSSGASAQTACLVPGQFHPFNLRIVSAFGLRSHLKWLNPKGKQRRWRQQDQPPYWAFGGVVACPAGEYKANLYAPFCTPAAYLPVSTEEALDINTPEDLEHAEAIWDMMEKRNA